MQKIYHCQQIGAAAGGEILPDEGTIQFFQGFLLGEGVFFQKCGNGIARFAAGLQIGAGEKGGVLCHHQHMQQGGATGIVQTQTLGQARGENLQTDF